MEELDKWMSMHRNGMWEPCFSVLSTHRRLQQLCQSPINPGVEPREPSPHTLWYTQITHLGLTALKYSV